MKAKLCTVSGYEEIKNKQDTITLLKEIKKICYNFQEKNYAPAALFQVLDRFINCKQKEDMTDQ